MMNNKVTMCFSSYFVSATFLCSISYLLHPNNIDYVTVHNQFLIMAFQYRNYLLYLCSPLFKGTWRTFRSVFSMSHNRVEHQTDLMLYVQERPRVYVQDLCLIVTVPSCQVTNKATLYCVTNYFYYIRCSKIRWIL